MKTRGLAGKKRGKRHLVMIPERQKRGGKDWIRRSRWRYGAFFFVAAGLVWAGWQTPGLFTHSDVFRLTALEVKGHRMLSGEEILEASGLKMGDNIFAVDLREVEKRLERLPWIEKALVSRRPPDRLAIDIVERRRLAWIDLGQIYGIDAEGVLLPGDRRPGESYRDLDLPVITGVKCEADSLCPGAVVKDSTLSVLLDWWRRASAADAEFCMNVSEIQPMKDGGIRLKLVGDDLEVRLPVDEVEKRIGVLKSLMKRVYRECPDPAYVDLRFAGQVVVGTKEQSSHGK